MAIDLAKIHDVARASLMPDFFAVRIDEEGLFDGLKQLIARINLDGTESPARSDQADQRSRLGRHHVHRGDQAGGPVRDSAGHPHQDSGEVTGRPVVCGIADPRATAQCSGS